MDLYPFFDALELSPVGSVIRDSLWLFPVIEAVHLLGLATLGGAVLLVDLTLLRVGLRAPAAAVHRAARPWFLTGFWVLVGTGLLLAFSEATKLYGKPAFWVKMTALALAILFTLLVRNPLVRRERAGALVALISIGLWLVVAAAGRWIGFS